jgi:GNAT superfamily N-acetyltransferase
VAEIREIVQGQTDQAGEAMLALRPRWVTADAVANFIDTDLRPVGYRLAGVFEADGTPAVSVIGFREMSSTAFGHYLYVDDLSTVVAARGRGYADALMRWAFAEAQRLNCEAVHLDSGVGSDRASAHRLYMRNRMRITAHHFAVTVRSG